jgi:pseudaminic acid biosynthesis-associated methylase
MRNSTAQMKVWSKEFGKKYTDRNTLTIKGLNNLYRKNYGISREQLNRLFLGKLNRNLKILEVGTNIGNQLLLLQKMGFKHLYGIEINQYALEIARRRTKNINIIEGSILDIPFKDKFFDLVFTSGVLIHIHPKSVKKALKEVCRCSSKYIWGFEYYADNYQNLLYRGRKNLLWKANFPQIYAKTCPNLKITKIKFVKYLQDDNQDVMFLLKKKNG